jgi:hypothetical protein
VGEGLGGGVRVWETGFVCIHAKLVRGSGANSPCVCVTRHSPPWGGGGEGSLSSLSVSLSLVCVFVCVFVCG